MFKTVRKRWKKSFPTDKTIISRQRLIFLNPWIGFPTAKALSRIYKSAEINPRDSKIFTFFDATEEIKLFFDLSEDMKESIAMCRTGRSGEGFLSIDMKNPYFFR